MKKILLFFLLVISVHAQSQKTVTPNWVKSVAQDTATVLRAEIALKMNSSAFADSFDNRFSATSIAAIKEVAEYERLIADSSILLYSGGVWSIFDLSEALSATANNAINITYPDANTISFNDTNVLLLDPLTLEINGSNQLTVIGGTGGSVGNADSLGGKPASEYLVKNDSTAQRTFSDLKYVDKASTQTITGEKTFSGNKTVFGTTTNDSVAVRGRLNVSGNIIGLTGKFSNLSNNTIPYNNTSTGLADSRISQDANTTYIRGGSTATSLGSELLTNGTFDTDLSGWTAGAGWGWDSGTAKHTTGNTATLEQSFSTSNNVMYQITVTITNRTAGSITLSFNNGQQNYAGITATGTYHILSTLTGSNKIIITPTTDFNGSMDEVSVKLLTASLPSFILKNTDNSNSGVQIRTGNSANNFYFGIDAGKNNTTGVYNSAIGYQALLSNTIGQLNSAIGYQALYSNTSGYYNSAIGYQALRSNTSGYYNSAIGRDALYSNTTGYSNSAIGRDALYSNTTGNYNSAIGYFALRSIVGQGNIGISYQAGRYNADNSEHTTGNYSNYFGYDTKASTNGVSNENVFGYQAVGMGSNTFVFGSNAITDTYLKGKVHINNDLDVDGYGYFADSIVVGNSTVKIYPDSITVGGTRVAKITDGQSIIGTTATLDSLITDYWNDNLGGGSSWDSTYAYQKITSLENNVSALQDSVTSFRNILNSILTALDTCGCGVVVTDNTPPNPPTSFTAIGGTSQTQYVSTWTDPVAGDLDSIRFYEGTSNDTTALVWVTSIAKGVETYTRTGRTANTTYWAGVKAVDDSGNVSWFSNLDSAKTLASGSPPDTGFYKFDAEDGLANLVLENGGFITDTSGFAHTGTHSYKFRGNGTTAPVYADIYPFPSGYGGEATIWVSYYVYIPSSTTTNVTSGNYQFLTLFGDSSDVNGDAGWLGISTDASGNIDNWVKPWGTELSTGFATDTWLKVEHKYVRGTGANGQDSIWVNGTLIYGTSNATGTITTSRFRFGYPGGNSWRPLSGEAIYFDDIILKRTRVQ